MDVSPTVMDNANNNNQNDATTAAAESVSVSAPPSAVPSPPTPPPPPPVATKTIVGATVRRENSKIKPKLCGEQISKQKVDANTQPLKKASSNEAMPNSARNLQPTTTQTKIPTKRWMTIKSSNVKSNMPAAKTYTPRAPGLTKRSGSTISFRSVRSQKNEVGTPTLSSLAKTGSFAGDHENHKLSAHERVAENNKLKVFQNLHKRLQDMQLDFMKKFENFKITSPDKIKEDYQFITMIPNDDCKLVVREGDMLKESKKDSQSTDKQIFDLKRAHAEEMLRREKEFKDRSDAEVLKKDTQIVDLHKKLKQTEKQYEKLTNSVQKATEEKSNEQAEHIRLLEELKACNDNIHSLTKKLNRAENELTSQKKENNEILERFNKLEADLEAAKKNVDENRSKTKSETTHQMHEQAKEIAKLKSCMETVERERHALECQVEDMKLDCSSLSQVQSQLKEAHDEIRALQITVEAQNLKESNQRTRPEVHNELAKLRQSETEKRREIEKLKIQMSKAHFSIGQLEEQIQRDQQLLEVRTELIDSLQTSDKSQRVHMDEMFAQMANKNNIINEVGLNSELHSKSEEFRNLFSTLSTKQMELSRQEHMIKLLEESNERSRMLHMTQEENINRMKEEIAHLRQTIHIYQENMRGNENCKNLLFVPVPPPAAEDYNENFYYYSSERRRKRQVDIKVKKYEA